MKNPSLDSLSNFHFVVVKVKERSDSLQIRQFMAGGTRRRQAPCGKAIVNNFDNYTIIYYLTALGYWVGK